MIDDIPFSFIIISTILFMIGLTTIGTLSIVLIGIYIYTKNKTTNRIKEIKQLPINTLF